MTAVPTPIPTAPPAAVPFCKWAGGKRQLAPAILDLLPHPIRGRYFEPFAGGGAVFFALAAAGRIPPRGAVLGDTNAELIDTYRAIRDDAAAVITILRQYTNDAEMYYRTRAIDPAALPIAERAARFLFLNRVGFNGLYRVNRAGRFNVPFGTYDNPTICDADNLRAAARTLARQELFALPFEEVMATARAGDVVYCDPPYWPVSKTANFTAYQAGGFGPAAQTRLRDVARDLVDRGVFVLLSNADAPAVRDLYADFEVHTVTARRAINRDADKRGAVGELLLVGKARS